MSRLERHFRANGKRNRLLFEELLELLTLFEQNDIPAIPFKGPVLAMLLYGDVALREFGDLDVYVPADRAARAKRLLTARGCRLHVLGRNSVLAECGNHGRVRLDLQWGFSAPRFRVPIDVDRLWSRIERVSVGGTTVWQPAQVDQLLMLTVHAAKHCWSKLKWISDIAAFIARHDGLDWRGTMEEATQLGGARLVLLGTRLAHDVLGTTVPDELVTRLQGDRAVAPLASELRRRLFAQIKKPNDIRGSYGNIGATLLHIRSRERVREKLPQVSYVLGHPLRAARASLVPNYHDRAFIAVPRYLGFLYYVIRPIRLTTQYATGVMQRVHRYSSTDA
jgi:hypothetical protein